MTYWLHPHLTTKELLTTFFKKSQAVRQKLELPGQLAQARSVADGLCGSDANSGRRGSNPENQGAGINVSQGRGPSRLGPLPQPRDEPKINPVMLEIVKIQPLRSPPKPWRRDRQHGITDAIAEMKWWASFHPEDSRPKSLPRLSAPVALPPAPPSTDYVAPQPFVREPKIGRNGPCPCGSGKKYKKCCGNG
ncbi:MAG TPA: SEC-C metal-binding domain-containing protein [Verrucomicrobiae bacterium]|nr:SEC-C metal-binding domain-containing protein [Verrucomicrobiae bacterium]